jgi:hypothetical protein
MLWLFRADIKNAVMQLRVITVLPLADSLYIKGVTVVENE